MVFWVQDGVSGSAVYLYYCVANWDCGLCAHTLMMENILQVPFICLRLFPKFFTYSNAYTFLDSPMIYTLFSPFTHKETEL